MAGRGGQFLERNPCADLQFACWRHRHRDRSELRSVHKTIRRTQVRLVERVEGLRTELEGGPFREVERTHQSKVEGLQGWAIDGIPTDVAKGVGRRRNESSGIEPLRGVARAATKYGLTGSIGPYGVFPQN